VPKVKSQTKRAVYVHNSHEQLRYKLSEVESLYHHLDQSGKFPIPDGNLSIAILSKKDMEQLHSDFLQDASLTDVITFDGDPEAQTAGEICVSPDYALAYATRHNLSSCEELALYLVHGYLHLAGYDDRTPPDKQKMRRAEKKAMTYLKEKNALPSFEGLSRKLDKNP
jgi:probable rRNA maturation factor